MNMIRKCLLIRFSKRREEKSKGEEENRLVSLDIVCREVH